MREFESLVYLDLQKTGTTSIVAFLRSALKENEVKHGGHSAPEKGHDTSKLHFISVRHPLSIYISLFGHGVSGKGGLFRGLQRKGNAEGLYEPSLSGFTKWLEFMLDRENAGIIRKKFEASNVNHLCGPLSHRLLMLSVVDPVHNLSREALRSKEHLASFYHQNRIYTNYVRTEALASDLLQVWNIAKERTQIKKRFKKVNTVEQLSALIPRKNVGNKIEGLSRESVPAELQARVKEAEWLFFDVFGYDEGKGHAPPLAPPITEVTTTTKSDMGA